MLYMDGKLRKLGVRCNKDYIFLMPNERVVIDLN